MKLNRFAAVALAACSGSALAQSSVTLYGVVDANIEYVNHVGAVPTAANGFNPGPGHDVVRMNSGGLSGSRWGIRGVEDLGAGTQAVFVLENGFSGDTGTMQQSSRLFGRQAFVGIKNATYGQISLGRQYTSLFDSIVNFVPAYFATQYEPITLFAGANFREDNTIKYTLNAGQFTGVAHYSFGTGLALPQTVQSGLAIGGNGEVPGQARRDSAYGASLSYAGGSLWAAIAYDQFNPTIGTTTSASSGSFKKATAALSYSLPWGRIMGGYRWGQNKTPAGATIGRDDFFWVGGIYQVGPALSLTLEYDYDKVRNVFGNTSVANPWQVNLIADYSLSKRTDVYLSAAYAKNAGLMLDSALIAYANSLSLGNSYVLGNGNSSMLGVSVGVRHKF
ncbi:porin [Cupriavidus metallidurans]|uniref:Outer membrane porin n=1 Tax=Cupriavidus metallidurans (strain ATCC 43123 / DSM 2839 / NBRC 102507 / CH34) TaxID=266264 RepID=Q1LGS0_CUPMC|nr:porin [Cupriavidus metallidurans]ABF10656.1 putative outer membrane porin [Cupriavidus metallidurans CH34]QGS31876.1 porin [Cupriavidus metallidurans]